MIKLIFSKTGVDISQIFCIFVNYPQLCKKVQTNFLSFAASPKYNLNQKRETTLSTIYIYVYLNGTRSRVSTHASPLYSS